MTEQRENKGCGCGLLVLVLLILGLGFASCTNIGSDKQMRPDDGPSDGIGTLQDLDVSPGGYFFRRDGGMAEPGSNPPSKTKQASKADPEK